MDDCIIIVYGYVEVCDKKTCRFYDYDCEEIILHSSLD